MIRWLLRRIGWYRRYGVRFDSSEAGSREQTGFKSRRHAANWARDHCKDCRLKDEKQRAYCKHFVVFDYEPALDMRLPGLSHSERPSFRP
jgi:hypothetical protein